MDLILKTTEWQGLIWVLLAWVMIKELKAHGKDIFDERVTPFDKDRLIRLAYTFVFPIVVLFHEGGHALATILMGGEVREFHYGFWIGYVIPAGNFTAMQDLIITLAGNVVQIAFGFIFLLFALVARSPAMVALWIYSSIFAIAGTVLGYTIFSVLTGEGDWAMIYRSPEKGAIDIIMACHIVLAALSIYMVNGKAPRFWFFKRLNPDWIEQLKILQQHVIDEPSDEANLRLAVHYLQPPDFKSARNCLMAIAEPDYRAMLLLAYIENTENQPSKALAECQKILDTYDDALVLSQAMCLYAQILPRVPHQENPLERAREYLNKAIILAPEYGDPKFYMVMNLMQSREFEAAKSLLEKLNTDKNHLIWINSSLAEEVLPELNALKSNQTQTRR